MSKLKSNPSVSDSNQSTVVLIDMDYLHQQIHRFGYSQTHIVELELIDSICKVQHINKQLSSFYAFHGSTKITDLFSTRRYKHFKLVRCEQWTCFEMEYIVVESLLAAKRVLLVVDSTEYLVLQKLAERGYGVKALSHRKEKRLDRSVMPCLLQDHGMSCVLANCLSEEP